MENTEQATAIMERPTKRKGRPKSVKPTTMPKPKQLEVRQVSTPKSSPNIAVRRRKRVVIEESYEDVKNEADYVPVTFRFYNDEQKDIPVEYSWEDKWIKPGQCKGTFYDGQVYTLPKIVYEYYRDRCSIPKYSNQSKEIIPGQMNKVSVETGRIRRFRMDVIS